MSYSQSEPEVPNFGFPNQTKYIYKAEFDTLLGYGPVTLKLDNTGRIYVTGNGLPICLINSDGTINKTIFDIEIPIDNYPAFTRFVGVSIIFQDDGKIVVAGYLTSSFEKDFAVIRYEKSGDLDNSFGISGMSTVDFNNQSDFVNSAIIQEDGKIILAGYTQYENNGSYSKFALARFNTDGSIDEEFGDNGKEITEIDTDWNHCEKIALQSDGKIIAAGWSTDFSNLSSAVVRYNKNGSIDSTFGNLGKIKGKIDRGYTMFVQPDDKILVGGEDSSCFALERYSKNGSIDTSFGKSGKVKTDFFWYVDNENQKSAQIPPPDGSRILTMYFQEDEKIIATGFSDGYDYGGQAFARYLSNGDLDKSFTNSGRIVIDFGKLSWWSSSSYLPNIGCVFAVEGYSEENRDEIVIYGFFNELNLGVVDGPVNPENISIYPNPIKTNFKLVYELQEEGNIEICLYNTSGEKVAVLLQNSFRGRGEHIEPIFLPSNISSGQYIISMTCNDKHSNIKIVIL